MVITHNVELINKVCTDIWVIEEGKVHKFPGEFEVRARITKTR
jgi:ATPase subunit of ABC transporter with duplicated ATPase domains